MPIKSSDSGRFKSAKHSKAKRNKSLRLGPATRGWNKLRASKNAQNATNPLRMVTDSAKATFNPDKAPIRLERASCILQSEAALNAVCEAVHSNAFNDYSPSVGLATARSAIAEAPFTADDVVLASGCSHALELAIAAVAEPGQNILVPGTGFPHYSTLCRANGIESRGYRLRVGLDWLVDTAHLESCIDANTRAIVVNNPANPSGTVFPKAHLEHILRIADKHKATKIVRKPFHPIATLRPKIPTIVCDGISKRYSVPGWRLGWLIVHDRGSGVFADIKQGIVALCQKTGGPCILVQAALPRILRLPTPIEQGGWN